MDVDNLLQADEARMDLAMMSGADDRSLAEASRAVRLLPGLFAGTGILTHNGYRAIEELRRGDLVATPFGRGPAFATIAWVGRRRVLGAINRPAVDIPIRVRQHAIADDTPIRDVRLAPDHAIYLDGCPYPARRLLDGVGLVWDVPQVGPDYWMFQLDRHAVVVADGLPVESLTDPAGRAAYTEVPRSALPLASYADA
jgi:hypothetical protein